MSPFTKRLALIAGSLGATGVLMAGASFALFTSQATPQTDTFAAGTVTLANNADASTCNITASNLEAGDQGSCKYVVTYSGSLAAWIGLDVSTSSTAMAATTPQGSVTSEGGSILLDGGANQMTLAIKDSYGNTFGYGTPTKNVTTGVWSSSDGPQQVLKVGTTDTMNDGSVTNGWTDTFTVTGTLPLDAGNQYEGASTTVTLQAQAVQESNNIKKDANGNPVGPLYWDNSDLNG